MAVAYERREPPAPPERIAELERRLGRSLPAAYRDYLAEVDGGRLANNDEAVNSVYGVGDVPDWASLWKKLDVFGDRVPAWLLPVADNAFGDLLCLSLRDGDAGSVWFWDHEEEAEEDEPLTTANLTFKAGSWPDFLASLQAE